MNILVTFSKGQWITNPNHAEVPVGTIVRWVLRAKDMPNRQLIWRVHFPEKLPFGDTYRTLKVLTLRRRPTLRGQFRGPKGGVGSFSHHGRTLMFKADRPGDYKYDLCLVDGATGQTVGDEDPWLHVFMR